MRWLRNLLNPRYAWYVVVSDDMMKDIQHRIFLDEKTLNRWVHMMTKEEGAKHVVVLIKQCKLLANNSGD